MLASELISDAIYLSMQDETQQPAIEPGLTGIALRVLNLLLDEYRDKIPYTFEYVFDDVNDLQNTRFVAIDDVAYVIGNVICELYCMNLLRWREITVVENLVGFPSAYFFDESTQSVRIYPTPNNPQYQFIVNGRLALGPLSLNTVLPSNMPMYLISVLEYELAYRMSQKYGVVWSPEKEATRQELKKQARDKQVIDVTPQLDVLFSPNNPDAAPFPYLFYLNGGMGASSG